MRAALSESASVRVERCINIYFFDKYLFLIVNTTHTMISVCKIKLHGCIDTYIDYRSVIDIYIDLYILKYKVYKY